MEVEQRPHGPRLLLLLALASATGCALGDGEGFGQLTARLSGAFSGLEPARNRIQPDGWYRANNSFELSLATLSVAVREVTLLGDTGAGRSPDPTADSCAFDPANPPPGCTLCHGGHCHCDGALKDYAELEAEVCGEASVSAAVPVARFETISPLPLLSPIAEQSLADCSAGTDPRLTQQRGTACELDRGTIEQVRLLVDRLSVSAALRDPSLENRLSGDQLQIVVENDLAGAPLTVELPAAAPVDRDHDYHLELAVTLRVSDKLFDDVPWHQLQREGSSIVVDATHNAGAAEALTTNLAMSVLQAALHRPDDLAAGQDISGGPDAPHADGTEDNTNEEGCEHITEGPFEPPTGATPAGSDAAGAVEIKADHRAYRVGIAADTEGWVKYLADRPGELLAFLSVDLPLVARDALGDPVDIEKRADVGECSAVAKRHTIDIPGPGTFFFLIGGQGTAATTVTIVVEAGDHHHHDGGH